MENKENEKPITLSDLGKFTEEVLLPAVDGIIEKRISGLEDRISGLEDRISGLEDRIIRLEDRIIRLENKIGRLEEEMAEVRDDISKMKNDILNGQDSLAKLIEDKRENEAMDTSIRQRFEEKFEDYGERIKVVEEKVGISV